MSDQGQPSPKSISLFTIILLVAGVTLSVVGITLWFVDGSRDTPLIILKAETTPFKIKPENPGGLTINSQNSPVMGLLDKPEEDQAGKEVLVPPESEPELPPIAVDENAALSGSDSKAEKTEEPAESTGAVPEEKDESEKSSDNQTASAASSVNSENSPKVDATETASATAETPVTENAKDSSDEVSENSAQSAGDQKPVEESEPVPVDKPVVQQAENSEQEQAATPENIDDAVEAVLNAPPQTLPKKRPRTVDGRPYFVIQFAAFKTEKSAKTTAALLSQKHAERLNGVELGHIKRGEYWRVVSDPMPRADAARLCSVFRSVGQDCITKLLEETP